MFQLLVSLLDEEQAKLITLMIVSIALSSLLYFIHSKYLILGVSISSSIVLQSILFPTEKYLLWAQQPIVYVLMYIVPRKNVGFIVLLQSFIYLTLIQVRRMYISYGVNGVDITATLMMQVFLYVGLAYNYQNGGKDESKLSQSARKRCVKNLPNYFQYLGYILFLPSCLIGPVFQFRDFEDYLNRSGDYSKIPSTVPAMISELKSCLFSLAIYVGTSSFQLSYTITGEYDQSSYIYKILYIGGVILHIEFKYITVFSLGMISVHGSGLSYDANQQNFNKIQTTRIYDFFLNPSLKIKAQSWNIAVQIALRRYIYENIYDPMEDYKDQKTKKKVQAKAQQTTLLMSALWHGLYPGYVISFIHWMFYLRINQQMYRIKKKYPKFQEKWQKFKLDVIENLIGNYIFFYFGMFFHLMTFDNIFQLLKTTYMLPFFTLYIAYALITRTKWLQTKAMKVQ